MGFNNYFKIDGLDFWDEYGVFVEGGTDDFLVFPERKESIIHDWNDEDGIDIDTSTPYFKEREFTLKCALIADNEADFWAKYEAFINKWMEPGARQLEVVELSKEFFVIYQKCTQFTRFTRLKTANRIACKFTIQIMEPQPLSVLTDEFGEVITDEFDNPIYA